MSSDKPTHIIGIIGVRDARRNLYKNGEYVSATLDDHLKKHSISPSNVSITTGGGRGTEQLVIDWCKERGIPFETIPPNIAGLGAQKAFQVRNSRIVSQADQLILFWDGYTDNLGDCVVSAMHMKKFATVYPTI